MVEGVVVVVEVVVPGSRKDGVESDLTETGPGPRGGAMVAGDCKGSTEGMEGLVEEVELLCARVITTVVAKSDADTTLVEMIVFVAGGAVLGAIVTVSVTARLCVTVSITVIGMASDVAAGPPSTGTTE